MNKIGFFYQTSHNPCAVEMNLTQIKKYHPDSPIVIWEDVSNLCEEICKKYNVPYKKVYRLNEDTQFHQSQPVTELTGGLRYLNRIYVSCMNELKDADWIIHYEDDVWIKNTLSEFPKTEWGGGLGMLWDHPLMDYLEKTLNIKGLDRYHSACGGVVISRQAFINAYLKVQDIDWVEISKMDKYVSRYSDAIISYLLLFNKCKWSSWDQWSQGGYKDFVAYEKPIIHNIKYWYRHNIEDLDKINSQDNVKFFLENNS
jgi:hypothetical protein